MTTNKITDNEAFARFVNHVFNEKDGSLYTDAYIQPGQPVRVRIGSHQWVDLEYQDQGKPGPVVFTPADFDALLTNMFTRLTHRAGEPTKKWQDILSQANGCLHPMITLAAPSHDGAADTSFRVRSTLQRQDMGAYGLMLRCLRPVPETIEELGLPSTLHSLCQARHGLVLVTGRTGAGKSTTTAALIHQINKLTSSNIVIIEEPIEFIHRPLRARFTYREVGVDVDTYANAVEQVLRYVPDVISIGEIRDAETMRAAVRAGESGHLVFGTLHGANTTGAIRKALGYLETPGEKLSFASNLVGVVAQALLPTSTGNGKALAYEVMDFTSKRNGTTALAETVEKMLSSSSDGTELRQFETEFLTSSSKLGLGNSPFINSLFRLVKDGKVESKNALSLLTDSASMQRLSDLAVGGGARK
ncbi:type IV pilus twitching motility protein PilT [Xylophilus sp. ASV27]|uniref:type IV pilus twitching motility protein PilT n=1 Tax=Xylophilus sp. ASV27 TaxID=2795129 RepID=UPI0018ED7572|nr:ATPase, T2SS/T4P/T4SS family [Xylophilus sp. ASV27]